MFLHLQSKQYERYRLMNGWAVWSFKRTKRRENSAKEILIQLQKGLCKTSWQNDSCWLNCPKNPKNRKLRPVSTFQFRLLNWIYEMLFYCHVHETINLFWSHALWRPAQTCSSPGPCSARVYGDFVPTPPYRNSALIGVVIPCHFQLCVSP